MNSEQASLLREGDRIAVEGVAQGEVISEERNEYIPSKCINMQNNFMNIHWIYAHKRSELSSLNFKILPLKYLILIRKGGF